MINALLGQNHSAILMDLLADYYSNNNSSSTIIATIVNNSRSSGKTILPLVTNALVNHIQSLVIDSIELPPLLRACEILGKYLVHR